MSAASDMAKLLRAIKQDAVTSERERIIKLLFKHSPAELGNEPITYEPVSMCGDLCHLRSDDEGWEWKDHFIALIKGEK